MIADAPEWPRYDPRMSYDWNYLHPPEPPGRSPPLPPLPGNWTFCGRRVESPLGVAAGPLLNGAWLLYYAALGFDVLTYKTVRSGPRACFPWPNLQPVRCGPLRGDETRLPASEVMEGSWAVSFGMPSQPPDVWRRDLEDTRRRLSPEKLLSVSVVGTIQEGWTLDDLAEDYARCARWARDSGADAVEANFSCPNVSSCDGQLYQHPADAAQVAARLRDAVGALPILLKIGHVTRREEAAALLAAVAPFIDGLAMTNSIAATVVGPDGSPLFDGARRGICGAATLAASIAQTRLFAETMASQPKRLHLVGVGGARCAADVCAYRAAGADSVHLATACMVDPHVACRIRADWNAAQE